MDEKRLIDANSILDDFLKRYTEMEKDGKLVFAACEIKQDFADMISNATTVDAVEVVRCEKCKHAFYDEENEMWKCVESAEYDDVSGEWFGFFEYHNGDFFCADGTRKVSDGND